MILTCPSCGTRYQTENARLTAAGRNVRCARCGHVWFQRPPETENEPEPEPVIEEPELSPGPVAPSGAMGAALNAPAASRFPVIAGWIALLAVVAALIWAVLAYRQTVAELWPPAASLYAVLGMPVNIRGLAIEDVAFAREEDAGRPVLAVSGRVVNISGRALPVPLLAVALKDETEHELYRWTFEPGAETLEPGTETAFVTRLASPPAEARALDVRFTDKPAP